MFSKAYSLDGKTVFYFDYADNKYVATGGSLAWRLNNPGLVHNTCRFFSRPGSIGHFGHYAIFSSPEKGREALRNWLHTKKFFNGSLRILAKHYQPDNPNLFADRLSSLTNIPLYTKPKDLSKKDFDKLIFGIEKLCDYALKGAEAFCLIPKILGKIENNSQEDLYWIGDYTTLSKKDAALWVQSNRLDAVVVHGYNGNVFLRSRPNHNIHHLHIPITPPPIPADDPSLIRVVGSKKPKQCIWAFINGILNTKESALEAATKISAMTGGERVLSMQNDTKWIIDAVNCLLLKASIDISIINRAVTFLRYLLALEKEENAPIVVFAHSQGGIILEHALVLLQPEENKRIRVFTFGGGSFIREGISHSDSHNYASAADPVCLLGSPNLQPIALQRYYAHKEGLTDSQMIHEWAFRDVILELDSIDPNIIAILTEKKVRYYQSLFAKLKNLTILDPDPDSHWKHKLLSDCYQVTIQKIINHYHK